MFCLPPGDIRFAEVPQQTTFACGVPLGETLKQLLYGQVRIEDLGVLTVKLVS